MRSSVLCVGGATVDRTYRLDAPLLAGTSNPAAGSSSFGGVARNVAENLARHGVAVGLLSRVGADEGGRALLKHLDALGIDRRGTGVVDDAATADYVAVLGPDGNLVVGLAAMAILDGLTPAALARQAGLFAAADWVFADCNLPAASLLALARRDLPGRYRLAVDAVSVAKAARLPDRLDGVDLVFANYDEAAALATRSGRSDAATDRAGAHAEDLLAAGAGAAVVTLGAGGALAVDRDGTVHVPAVPARVVDVTGAGDALIAATLCGLGTGEALAAAVARGCAAAARTVARVAATPDDLPREA